MLRFSRIALCTQYVRYDRERLTYVRTQTDNLIDDTIFQFRSFGFRTKERLGKIKLVVGFYSTDRPTAGDSINRTSHAKK